MQTATQDPEGTYEQGDGSKFSYDRFFDASKNWYQIATNSRPETSIVNKVLNRATTCENVVAHYSKGPDGVISYVNYCYLQGKRNPSLDRTGRLIPQSLDVPFFHMKDSKTGKEVPFNVAVTDYDNFAIVTDRGKYFWILSRKTSICSNAFHYITNKLVSKGYNVSSITLDLRAMKHCDEKGGEVEK